MHNTPLRTNLEAEAEECPIGGSNVFFLPQIIHCLATTGHLPRAISAHYGPLWNINTGPEYDLLSHYKMQTVIHCQYAVLASTQYNC